MATRADRRRLEITTAELAALEIELETVERSTRARDELEAEVTLLETAIEIEARKRDLAHGLVPPGVTRALFDHEITARVNFATIQSELDKAQDRIARRLLEDRERFLAGIEAELRKVAQAGYKGATGARAVASYVTDLADPSITMPAELRRAVRPLLFEGMPYYQEALEQAARAGADNVIAEAARQGIPKPPAVELPEVITEDLRYKARALANPDTGLVKALETRARALPATRMTGDEAVDDLVDTGRKLSPKGLEDQARTSSNGAYGQGRRLGAEVLPVPAAIYASELLDSNTCGPCSAIDGKHYATVEESLEDYPDGNYVGCLGGDRCRGTRVFVWDEEAPPTLDVPGDRPLPGAGTPGGPPLPRPPRAPGPAPGAKAPSVGDPPTEIDLDGPGLPDLPPSASYDERLRLANLSWNPSSKPALEARLGRELVEGERLHLRGGGIHGTEFGDQVAEVYRGRLVVIERGATEGYGLTEGEIMDRLKGYLDTIPEEFADALDTIAAAGQSRTLDVGYVAATSNGPQIVYWVPPEGATSLAEPLSRATFDHELGHSIRHTINARLDTAERELIERYGGSIDLPPAAERELDLIRSLRAQGSNPGRRWGNVMRSDSAAGTRRARAVAQADGELIHSANRIANRLFDDAMAPASQVDPIDVPGVIDVLKVLKGEADALPGIIHPLEVRTMDLEELLTYAGEDVDAISQAIETARAEVVQEFGREGGSHALRVYGRGRWGGTERVGVTDYGASADVEDWAETIRLYLRDQRNGYIALTRSGGRVTFANLFPGRAKVLEELARILGFRWWSV